MTQARLAARPRTGTEGRDDVSGALAGIALLAVGIVAAVAVAAAASLRRARERRAVRGLLEAVQAVKPERGRRLAFDTDEPLVGRLGGAINALVDRAGGGE